MRRTALRPMQEKSRICACAPRANGVLACMEMAPATSTPRETEIVRLTAQDLSIIEIAVRLFVSIETIEGDQRRIARKLGAADINEIVRRAAREGIVDF